MISRRTILGGMALAGLAGFGAWGFGHVALDAEIVSMLQRRLSFLKLDPDGVRAFAKDQTAATFGKKIPTWDRIRYHLLTAGAPYFKRFYRSTDTRSSVAKIEDSIISTYLLSTDFFWHDASESRTVNYIAYYDPLRPCQNPFARPAVAASGPKPVFRELREIS